MSYCFHPKELKFKKLKNLQRSCMIKRYVTHMSTLKQGLNQELLLNKLHKLIRFNQEA